MIWNDSAFLLSKNKYNENSIIVEVYSENHGKCSGIIFGASSKKIKNYLQIGNLLHINHTYKNTNKIGYFKVEILKAFSPLYFHNQKKLMCLTSALNLIKLLTVEQQENSKIFILINEFFSILDNKNWIKDYIFWELNLLKLVGYDLELNNLVNKETIGNNQIYYCHWCNQQASVAYKSLPRDDNMKLLSCMAYNDYNHYMYDMIDNNKTIYQKCLKCEKKSYPHQQKNIA